MASPVLVARDLVKAFAADLLLDHVSLSIDERERVGLVGRNGAGKSTLAKILAGLEPTDGGEIAVRKGAEVAYLAQEPVLDPERTAREVVTDGLGPWRDATARHEAATARLSAGDHSALAAQTDAAADVERLGGWELGHSIDAILGHLGLTDRAESRVGTMSGGERRRVALARILVSRPALAVLDEPTNHLDTDTIEWLEGYLADDYEGALVLVTHDRYVLDRVVDRTLELARGKIYAYDGGYGQYLEAKAERQAHEAREESNRQNFLRRELDWLRRSPSARTGKQKARISRAEAVIAERGLQRDERVSLTLETKRTGKTIVDLRGLRIELGGRVLVRSLDLAVTKGERIGIVGPNGAGKTTLLRTVLGERAPTAGTVVRGAQTEVALLDQQRSGLEAGMSLLDAVTGGRPKVTVAGRTMDSRAWLEKFLFAPEKTRQPVEALSGGERARALLAKMLLAPANLLVLDEPTNDLDTDTLAALEEMLIESEATALVVTHDRWFLDRVATGILAFEGDGKVIKYEGNYANYLAQRPPPGQPAPKSAPPPPVAAREPKKKAALTYAERIELESLPGQIDAAETEIVRRETELADPALYASRAAEVPRLVQELDALRAAQAARLTRWEQLEEKKSA